MSKLDQGYTGIFKSTILFGGVKVTSLVTRIVINKIVAVLLGSSGLGIISLLYVSLDFIKTFFSFGIPQSAVRDVSIAFANSDEKRFSEVIFTTKRLVLITGALGAIFTILASPFLSFLAFGTYNYTTSFVFLSVFVFASIVNEGQIAIIRGIRNLKALAKATVFGSLVGLIFGVPIYYFLGEQGIVPSLIISAVSSLLFTWWLVTKIEHSRIKLSLREVYKGSLDMLRLGTALAGIAILGVASNFIIRAIVSNYGSISQVGIFEAGVVLIVSYFGIVMSALNTDFYPKMFAAVGSNSKLTKNLNTQLNSAFTILTPILCLFIFFMNFIIKILYTNEFLEAIDYMSFAIFSLLINVYSDTIGVVLIAKNDKRKIILIAIFSKLLLVVFSYYGFRYFGIKGLGIATLLGSLLNLLITGPLVYNKYNLFFDYAANKNALIMFVFVLSAVLIFHLNQVYIKYSLEAILLSILFYYTNRKLKEYMGFDIVNNFKSRFVGK